MKYSKHNNIAATVVLSFFSFIMVLGSFNLVNTAIAQVDTNLEQENITSDTSLNMQSRDNVTQQQIPIIENPDAQIIVLAEDLFEIRDNLAEAREALDRENFFELAEHINNLDHLVTVLINPLPENTSAFEQNRQQLQQQSTMNPNMENTNQTSS